MMKYLIFGVVLIINSIAGQGNFNKDGNASIPCEKHEDCHSAMPVTTNTSCINFECFCSTKPGEAYSLCNKSDIVVTTPKNQKPLVGRICKHEKDCALENGFCNTTRSQCECSKTFVPSTDHERCLLIATTIGFTCEDDKQCLAYLANTTCSNNVCRCVPGYHHSNSKCYKTVAVGEPCNFNEECTSVVGAECNAGVCVCSKDTVINPQNKKCLPLAQTIMDSCSESVQCSKKFGDKSECKENKCICQAQYHFDNDVHRCVINRRLGEPCEGNHECYQDETGYEKKALQCIANQCHCAAEFLKENNICVQSGAATITVSMALILSALLYVSF